MGRSKAVYNSVSNYEWRGGVAVSYFRTAKEAGLVYKNKPIQINNLSFYFDTEL